MKINWKKLTCIGVAAAMAMPLLAACNGGEGEGGYDNETRVLQMSSGDFDGVFNPFFATSAYDSNIIGQTQISLLGSDPEGKNVTYGVNEPVVALDYNETMYTANGAVSETGAANGTTVYQIVLKNGIKFSDGVELTAHDVLFNLYMYLDPTYTGSNTLYSTDIVGLQAYTTQDPNANDNTASTVNNTFNNLASLRILAISSYVSEESNWQTRVNTYNNTRKNLFTEYDNENGTNITARYTDYTEASIAADIADIKEEFRNELTTTYNTIDMTTFEQDYSFDQSKIWQGFFYTIGLISRTDDPAIPGNTVYLKDENGKYIIDWKGYDENEDYTAEEAIDVAFNALCSNDKSVASILAGWSTGTTMATNFAASDKELFYGAIVDETGHLTVESIEGIKILDASEFDGSTTYAEGEYDMLQITINGVDPKAKWNFAITVAPMHYYSTPELTAAAMADTDYSANFGVEFSSLTFMNTVKERNRVPMGAGVYKATTRSGDVYTWEADENWVPTAASEASFETLRTGFWSNNIVYLVRNDNFVTTGGNEEEVYNAKIKNVQYKVVATTQVMSALEGGSIDIADPSATTDNVNTVNASNTLNRVMVKTAGYGYIGINAKFITNINIRRAIMSVMDADLVQNYYPNGLSSPVYRSFSKTSWVYEAFDEDNVEAWNPESYYGFDATFAAARSWLTAENPNADKSLACTYDSANNVWLDEKGQPIELTFTVAGETYDHPAYATLLRASEILNANGIKTTLTTDANALYKLSSGGLAIWAAAWTSTVDPDMYQVYHKDSRATSVLNWGYDYLVQQGNATSMEMSIINELADLIEEGRETIDQAKRAEIYREASDVVMELAVELPLYQRADMYVYNEVVIDASSLYANPTPYMSPISQIWKISYNN